MNAETDEITNSQDTIDSRDVEARIKYLELEIEEGEERYTGEHLDLEEELGKLWALKKEIADNEEWEGGITLINDAYFEDYAREYAEDVGAINRDTAWPANCIDWEQAADELRMDYSEVELDGVTYYFR